jgi:hypothetical protein
MRWSNKITRTNRHRKSLHEKIWIAFLRSHLTSKQDAKHVINIFSQQIVLLVFITIMNIFQKNSLDRACKKKIVASEKAYNRHIFEEKQFTNRTFTFIYYRLLSQKYKHNSIISWSEMIKAIQFTRFSLYSSRLYRCTSERFRARFWLEFFFFRAILINSLESVLSRVHSRFFKRYKCFWFKSSRVLVNFAWTIISVFANLVVFVVVASCSKKTSKWSLYSK